MSLHEDVIAAIDRRIEELGGLVQLSPTTLALDVQMRFVPDDGKVEPHILWTSLEYFKHLARGRLRSRFDPEGENNEAYQGELFSGHLQRAYPVPRAKGQEPLYVPRDMLTREDVEYNVNLLRKSARARLRHADALQAWADSRGFAPA